MREYNALEVANDQIVRQWMCNCSSSYIIKTYEEMGIGREGVTQMALSLSLCPYHFIDYAICFDDQLPECAAIREVHPDHDS